MMIAQAPKWNGTALTHSCKLLILRPFLRCDQPAMLCCPTKKIMKAISTGMNGAVANIKRLQIHRVFRR